jgi:galactokinase/mevalonate kinase-like predicted kinase
MMIIVDPSKKHDLQRALSNISGMVVNAKLVEKGAESWTIFTNKHNKA